MAVNLAKKYSDKIAKYFTLKSVVDGNTSNDYKFTGVKTIEIYTPITQPLTDYNRTGINRYGTPSEMQDITQEMTLTRDRSFSITIDKGNNAEQLSIKEAGKMLRLELDEQVIPEMDKYALAQFACMAGKINAETSAPTKTTIVQMLSDAMVHMSNKKVPKDGRIIYIGWTNFGLLRLSTEYVGNDALGKKILERGALGEFMGSPVVPVPDEYLMRGEKKCYFLITYKTSVLQPKTIQDYFVKQNPPGINGALLEGRFRYDAFVLGAKADGVYASVESGGKQVTPTNTYTSSTKTMAIASTGASEIRYTLDGTDPRYSATAKSSTGASASVVLTDYAGKTVTFKSVALSGTLFTSDVVTTTQEVASS